MKRWIWGVLVLVIIIFALLFFRGEAGVIFEAATRISPVAFLIFFSVSVSNLWIYTIRWDLIIHAGSDKKILSQPKLLGVKFAAYALAYIIPSAQLAGEPLRLQTLEGAGVSRKEALAGMVLDKVFEAVTLAIFALLALLLLMVGAGGADVEGISIVVLSLGFLLFAAFFYFTIVKDGFFLMLFRLFQLHRVAALQKYEIKLQQTEQMMQDFFTNHHSELVWTIVISTMTYLILLLEYYIMLWSLGLSPSVMQVMVVSTLPLISYLVPTPGGVGALEVAQAGALQLAGLDPLFAVPLILYIRLRDVAFIVTGLLYLSTHGMSSFLKSRG